MPEMRTRVVQINQPGTDSQTEISNPIDLVRAQHRQKEAPKAPRRVITQNVPIFLVLHRPQGEEVEGLPQHHHSPGQVLRQHEEEASREHTVQGKWRILTNHGSHEQSAHIAGQEVLEDQVQQQEGHFLII